MMIDLPETHYKTIVMDPPWDGPSAVPTFKKGRKSVLIPYHAMNGYQVSAMNIRDIATDDSQLWIWAPSRNVGDATSLMQLWGFSYRALFIWKKPGLGLGRHVRHQAEFLLWSGRKGARLVEPKNCPRQIQEWPNPKRHSEKPAEAYALIASLGDGPRIDIFARQHRPGFDAWGDELPATQEA